MSISNLFLGLDEKPVLGFVNEYSVSTKLQNILQEAAPKKLNRDLSGTSALYNFDSFLLGFAFYAEPFAVHPSLAHTD